MLFNWIVCTIKVTRYSMAVEKGCEGDCQRQAAGICIEGFVAIDKPSTSALQGRACNDAALLHGKGTWTVGRLHRIPNLIA